MPRRPRSSATGGAGGAEIGGDGSAGSQHPAVPLAAPLAEGDVPGVATPTRNRRGGRQGKRRNPQAAQKLMEIMRKESVEAAWRALALLMDAGVRTDKYTLSKMMKVTLMEKRRSPQVIYLAIEQVERFLDLKQNDVDEVLFNALLDACCRLKDMQRLESIVARMHALKVVPSPVTLGILVKTYGQRGDLGKVCEYWEQMENQRTEANDVTYGCMLEACVKCGDLAKAVEAAKDWLETALKFDLPLCDAAADNIVL